LRTNQNLTGKTSQIYIKITVTYSYVNAVEVKTVNDTIDFEIRVNEGPLAYFNKITVVGNDKTNDRVIYRNGTKPEKNTIKITYRTIREIGQLGFF
jgi:outer membrane protein insertion porin family